MFLKEFLNLNPRGKLFYDKGENMSSLVHVEEITLLCGKKVKVRTGSVTCLNQVFLQLSENLIAGVVSKEGYSGVYVWKKENEIFEYLGDLSLHEESDGRVSWNIFANDVTKEDRNVAYCQRNCFYSLSPSHIRVFSTLNKKNNHK